MSQRTLADEMAVAILRGDRIAAYALADLLIEERDAGSTNMAQVAKELREHGGRAHDGYDVYRWPEFQAFCRRAGFLWDLHTINMKITINIGEMLKIEHEYAGSDNPQTPAG